MRRPCLALSTCASHLHGEIQIRRSNVNFEDLLQFKTDSVLVTGPWVSPTNSCRSTLTKTLTLDFSNTTEGKYFSILFFIIGRISFLLSGDKLSYSSPCKMRLLPPLRPRSKAPPFLRPDILRLRLSSALSNVFRTAIGLQLILESLGIHSSSSMNSLITLLRLKV